MEPEGSEQANEQKKKADNRKKKGRKRNDPGQEVVDLQEKINCLVCLHGGSTKRFCERLAEKAKDKGDLQLNDDKSYIGKTTIEDWQNGKRDTILYSFAENIPILLEVEKERFISDPAGEFFKYLMEKNAPKPNLYNSFKSFETHSEHSDMNRCCGCYFIYYPMLTGNDKISKAMIDIYRDDDLFKIRAYFKPGSRARKYAGVVSYCQNKLYLLFEATEAPKGITSIITNIPSDHDVIHPFHGVLISVSVDTGNPSAASVLFVPLKTCIGMNEDKVQRCESITDEKCQEVHEERIKEIGLYDPRDENLLKEIGEHGLSLLMNDLPGFVLVAKEEDTRKQKYLHVGMPLFDGD